MSKLQQKNTRPKRRQNAMKYLVFIAVCGEALVSPDQVWEDLITDNIRPKTVAELQAYIAQKY
jgi:hypothetical protein